MADYAVGVVGEDVVAAGVEVGALVELHGEVSGVEAPDGEASEEVGAPLGGGAIDVGVGKEAVEEVGDEDGPGEGDGEEEPEERDVQRDGEFVEEDGGGLEAALQRDFEGGDADPVWGGMWWLA